MESSITHQLYTIRQAADQIGLNYRQLLQAVNDGIVPHYRLGKSRMMVSLPEVLAIMQVQGGGHE